MKLQRYEIDEDPIGHFDDNGDWCKSEDVDSLENIYDALLFKFDEVLEYKEKLEQLNAEMLDMLQELNCDINGMSILLSKGTEFRLKAIIEKAEGMK